MQILAEEKRTQDAARAAAGPPAPEGGASEALHGAAPPAPAAAAVPSQGSENNVQGSSTEGCRMRLMLLQTRLSVTRYLVGIDCVCCCNLSVDCALFFISRHADALSSLTDATLRPIIS